MGIDFSALDAELDGLGGAPPDARQLADRFAGSVAALGDVDQELAQLGSAAEAVHAAPAAALFSAPAAQPVPDPQPPMMQVVAPAPEPAFDEEPALEQPAVEEPEDDDHDVEEAIAGLAEFTPAHEPSPAFAADEPAIEEESAAAQAIEELASDWPSLAAHEPSETVARESAPLTQSQEIVLPDPIPREELSHESGELRLDGEAPSSGSFSLAEPTTQMDAQREPLADLVDDVQDALAGSQPIALHQSVQPQRMEPPLSMDRDPDAEFDALLSEATDPRGMPTTSSDFDTEELLRGLELEEAQERALAESLEIGGLDEPEVGGFDEPEPEGDSTEVLDRNTALAIQGLQEDITIQDEALQADELDADELEIVMDDDDAPPVAVSKVPPPPPPPSSAPDKRPSLLGRLFNGKREE